MKWFLPFLAFIFLTEIAAEYQFFILHGNTHRLNYIVSIIETLFYGFIFYSLSDLPVVKRIVTVSTLINLIVHAVGMIFYYNSPNSLYYCIVISGIFISGYALSYLYYIITRVDDIQPLTEPGYWLAFGVSMFFSVGSVGLSLHNVIDQYSLVVFDRKLHQFIIQILCVILYSSISIAIILCKKRITISS